MGWPSSAGWTEGGGGLLSENLSNDSREGELDGESETGERWRTKAREDWGDEVVACGCGGLWLSVLSVTPVTVRLRFVLKKMKITSN